MNTISDILNEIGPDEQSIIVRGTNFTVITAPNWGKEKVLCFKMINKLTWSMEEEHDMCRISMTEPKYIGAEGETYQLSKDEIEELIYLLNQPNEWNLKYTNWQMLILLTNESHEMDEDWENIPLELPIPNYNMMI